MNLISIPFVYYHICIIRLDVEQKERESLAAIYFKIRNLDMGQGQPSHFGFPVDSAVNWLDQLAAVTSDGQMPIIANTRRHSNRLAVSGLPLRPNIDAEPQIPDYS